MVDELDAVDGAEQSDPGVRFEIDLEAEATPDPQGQPQVAQQGAPSSPPTGTPPPAAAPTDADLRYQALERDFQYLQSQITPYLQLQQQQLAQQNRPPRSLEEIQSDPNSTAKDLVEYISWLNNQQLAQMQAQTEATAVRASSTQQLRGLVTSEAMGAPGRDFDSIVSKHVAPIIRQNPWVREAVRAASPDNPALGEYILGMIAEISQQKGDLAQGLRAVWNGIGAEHRGAREAASRITEAQRRQAQLVVPGSQPGTARTRRLGPNDFRSMSDSDLDQFDRQMGVF